MDATLKYLRNSVSEFVICCDRSEEQCTSGDSVIDYTRSYQKAVFVVFQ
jgi:hypothetical protein